MKKTCLISVLVISLALVAGIMSAGCVQTAGNNQGQQNGNTVPAVQGTEQQGTSPGQAGTYSGQYHNRSMGNGTRPQVDLCISRFEAWGDRAAAVRSTGNREFDTG